MHPRPALRATLRSSLPPELARFVRRLPARMGDGDVSNKRVHGLAEQSEGQASSVTTKQSDVRHPGAPLGADCDWLAKQITHLTSNKDDGLLARETRAALVTWPDGTYHIGQIQP